MRTRVFSPYQFNPFNLNPLRRVLEDAVDFDALHGCQRTKLFLSTTKFRTGKVRVFKTEEITADVVMASACLPLLFQAVQIQVQHGLAFPALSARSGARHCRSMARCELREHRKTLNRGSAG